MTRYILPAIFIGCMFLVSTTAAYAGDEKATTGKGVESIYTADEQKQISAWNDRINYINTREQEIIKEIGKAEAERGQITGQFAAMNANAEKRKKAEKKEKK